MTKTRAREGEIVDVKEHPPPQVYGLSSRLFLSKGSGRGVALFIQESFFRTIPTVKISGTDSVNQV